MTGLNDTALAQIDTAVPRNDLGDPSGAGTPRQPICGKYSGIMKAVTALRKAVFRFSTQTVVPAQTLGESYDTRTMLPWTFKNALAVEIEMVLVARVKAPRKS